MPHLWILMDNPKELPTDSTAAWTTQALPTYPPPIRLKIIFLLIYNNKFIFAILRISEISKEKFSNKEIGGTTNGSIDKTLIIKYKCLEVKDIGEGENRKQTDVPTIPRYNLLF